MNKKTKRTVAISALLLAGAICLDSKYNLKVTEYSIPFENLPAAFEDFHIVQLSDLHGSEFGKDNRLLVERVRALEPDIIAITGDMADNAGNVHVFDTLLEGLRGIAPIYYVSGNHEWGGRCMPQVRELLEKHGVEYLSNEYMPIYRSGEKIIIAGTEDAFGPADMIKPHELIEKLREDYPDSFTMLLGHRNLWIEDYPSLPVDLILSGHAHGGIIRLPFVGGLLSVKHELFAEYEKGLYQGENYTLAVSCGLGNSIKIPRMFNRPELVSIFLKQS